MSTGSSLTYNYDKDSFEEGTFEDISELSLEETDSELDENYAMEVERTRIIMPKYSANNRKNLRTLIEEEQKDEGELEKSDTEQEDDKIENDNNEIEVINRTSDEGELDNSDIEYNERNQKHIKENLEMNVNEINNRSDNEEDNTTDSDEMDIEMNQYSNLSVNNNDKEKEINMDNDKKWDDDSDIEGNTDTDKEDAEMNQEINKSLQKLKNDYSNELLLDEEENEEEENEDEEKSDNEDNVTNNGTSVDLEISSKRPSSFNSDDNAYHLDFIKKSQSSLKSNGQNKSKNGNRNLSFSNDRLRDIERQNKILLQRILTKKPTYENLTTRNSNKTLQARRITSAAINRRKQQHQIDLDNQILKRKLESIALRRRANQ